MRLQNFYSRNLGLAFSDMGTIERCIDSCPRLLGDDSNVSLNLVGMTEGDVWNLAVDTGNPSSYVEKYKKVKDVTGGEEEEDGAGIKTERVEFVANGFMYSVQTTNRVKNEGRWEGRAEVKLVGIRGVYDSGPGSGSRVKS